MSWSGSTDWSPATPGTSNRSARGSPELRIDYGPGYRVYYLRDGERLILLLTGGDKSSQDDDIRQAHTIAQAWHDGKGDQS